MRSDLYFSATMCLRGGKQGDFCRSTDVVGGFFSLHLALFWEYANNPWNVWHQRSLINISQFHCAAFGSEIEQHSTFSLRTHTMQIEAAICCTQQEPRAASREWERRKVPLLMKELKYYTDYISRRLYSFWCVATFDDVWRLWHFIMKGKKFQTCVQNPHPHLETTCYL